MANRAYLYPSDVPGHERHRDRYYYDSRHTIPVGWFFFFRAADAVMVDRGEWQEVKLVAPKAEAVALFRSRRPLLEPYLRAPLLERAAAAIADDLTRWSGAYLWLDPMEVVEDDLHDMAQFEAIAACLDAPAPDPARIDAALRPYGGEFADDPETRLRQVLGYTYTWG